MTDHDPDLESLTDLPANEKALRAGSFGAVASHYERYRPGPPVAAVDWLLPKGAARIVDLGAGTGALTRLLVGRVEEVVAVEPDARMRAVLVDEVPGARAVDGRGEAMPLPDAWADAVIASSSWHWMDPVPALHEVGRVVRPGGWLGAVWSGPDGEGEFLRQAQALLAQEREEGRADGLGGIMADVRRPLPVLAIPPGVPFDQPEHDVFRWKAASNADELIGLLGTLSWIITMPDERRERVLADARRLLRELLDVDGDVTVDLEFRADMFRARRQG